MREISYLPDNTITQVRQSKQLFGSASDLLDPLKRVLNVYLSRWFGNASIKKGRKADVFEPTIEFLRRKDTEAWLNNPKAALPQSDYMNIAQIAETAQCAAAEKSFFHWELEFPEVFFAPAMHASQDVQVDPNGGFDAVIGNPPYGDILDANDKNYLKSIGFPNTGGRAEVYADFITSSLKQISGQRRLSFIIPNTMLDGAQFSEFRKSITSSVSISEIQDHRNRLVFDDANVQTMVMVLHKNSMGVNYTAPYRYWNTVVENFETGSLLIPDNSDTSWRMETPVTLKIKQGTCIPLGSGIGTCRDAGVDYKWKGMGWQKRGEKVSIATLLFYEGQQINKKDYPLIKGADIDRYSLDFNDTWLIHDFEKYRTKESAVQVYLSLALVLVKILTRQTSDRIQACIDYGQKVTAKSIHTIIPTAPNYNPLYVITVLNSTLMSYLYRTNTGEVGRLFAQVKLYDLRELPIPCIDFTTPAPRRAELAVEARTLAAQPDPAPLLAFTAARLSAGESDVIHDLLAALAEQMIDLNKRKQSEVKRFLTWLESQLQIRPDKDGAIGIDSLKKKSFIRDYLGDYQKGAPALSFDDPAHKMTLWYALMDNRTRVAATLPTLKPLLRDEYEKSLAALLPIKAALSRTDALIDRVVYQLYGLTDEEIRLIEYPGLSEAAGSARTEVLREPDIAQQPDPIVADKIVEKIEPAAAQYFARVDESGIEAQLRIEITSWDTLPPNVKKYLRTGETLLIRNNIEDYSGVMIYYAKAVELLLMARWFDPFKAAHSESDVFNEQAFKPYMRGEKSLTLGNVPFLLSSKELAFRAFLARAYPPDRYAAIIDSKTGFASVLTPETVARFRNGSAHTDDQAESDAQAARAWALRVIGYV